MGKGFVPPVIEEKDNAIAIQSEEVKSMDTSIGVPANKTPVGPADIHKNGFNNFILFLKGESHNGSLEERSEFQCDFIDSIPRLLTIGGQVAFDALDHMVTEIHANREVFNISDVFAPLYVVETTKKRSIDVIKRYRAFMTFMIGLADNGPRRAQYIANYDVRKLVAEFSPAAGQTLNNYVYR